MTPLLASPATRWLRPGTDLDGIDLQVAPGEVLGLVGESGSGKTSWPGRSCACCRATRAEAAAASALAGRDLRAPERADAPGARAADRHACSRTRQRAEPDLTLGAQVTEVLRRHAGWTARPRGRLRARRWAHVGLRGPARPSCAATRTRCRGGEKQRVVIAAAFAASPELLILDEPTTALDVITGARILDLFARMRAETGSRRCTSRTTWRWWPGWRTAWRCCSAGRIVEQAPARAVLQAPRGRYTRALVAPVPRPGRGCRRAARRSRCWAWSGSAVTYGQAPLVRRRRAGAGAGTSDVTVATGARSWAWWANPAPASRRWRAR